MEIACSTEAGTDACAHAAATGSTTRKIARLL